MEIFSYLQQHQMLALIFVALGSLCIGSFLNVVIHRLPKMMFSEWRSECSTFLELPENEQQQERFNLMIPRSHCPQCKQTIKPWHNIPVFSYLFLKGRCAFCQKNISLRYPLLELATAVLSVFAVWYFGFEIKTVFVLLFTWAMICEAMIDFDHQLLPDNITFPLLWLGLVINLNGMFATPQDAIIGAVSGYVVLWFFANLFLLVTGKLGMGNGDFKLFAALGAWMGWQLLPFIIIIAAVVGAIIGVAVTVITKRDKDIPIPFGPFLAIAGLIALYWGHDLTNVYLYHSGLGYL